TSLLIKYSDSRHFIVEQASGPEQLQANLDWLRNRTFSQNLTIFDFAPKSEDALEKIGRPAGELGQWEKFSAKIEDSINKFPTKGLRGEQAIDRFFDRLEKPDG